MSLLLIVLLSSIPVGAEKAPKLSDGRFEYQVLESLGELRAEIAELKARVKGVEKRMDALEGRIDRLEDRMIKWFQLLTGVLAVIFVGMFGTLLAIWRKVSAIEARGEVRAEQERVAKLETELKELRDRLAKLAPA